MAKTTGKGTLINENKSKLDRNKTSKRTTTYKNNLEKN